MNNNLDAYRNLGVPCLSFFCSHCNEETVFSAYFEADSARKKNCSLGCCECGRGYAISENSYEQLYELSFDFDRLQAGEISEEAFRELVPASCRKLLQEADKRKEQILDRVDASPAKEIAETASVVVSGEGALPDVMLRNRISDLAGIGGGLAVLSGGVFFGVSLVMDLPPWAVGWKRIAVYGFVMGLGLLAGVAMSYRRFPRQVLIKADGIQILGRGSAQPLQYNHRAVSRVNFGGGAKYLTLWLKDGKTFVVKAAPAEVEQLYRYFRKPS